MARQYNQKHDFHVGQRFGQWTVAEERQRGARRIRCRCDCGQEQSLTIQTLYLGKVPRCVACVAAKHDRQLAEHRAAVKVRGQRWHPPIGTVYGYLTTIAESRFRPFTTGQSGHPVVRVRCACGTEKDVRMSSLLSGATKSCGCRTGQLIRANRGAGRRQSVREALAVVS